MEKQDEITVKIMKTVYQLSEAFFILGCTMSGTLLAEKKHTIASAGFTMLAIAHGIFFASSYEIAPESYHKAVEIFVGGLSLFLPAMIMVSFHHHFPKWLRILGVLSCFPFFINAYFYFIDRLTPDIHEPIGSISYMLISITATFWGIYLRKSIIEEKTVINDI